MRRTFVNLLLAIALLATGGPVGLWASVPVGAIDAGVGVRTEIPPVSSELSLAERVDANAVPQLFTGHADGIGIPQLLISEQELDSETEDDDPTSGTPRGPTADRGVRSHSPRPPVGTGATADAGTLSAHDYRRAGLAPQRVRKHTLYCVYRI